MKAETIGRILDAAIPIVGGIYCYLLGIRKLGRKPGESAKYDRWHEKFGRLFKILGPLISLIAAARLVFYFSS